MHANFVSQLIMNLQGLGSYVRQVSQIWDMFGSEVIPESQLTNLVNQPSQHH